MKLRSVCIYCGSSPGKRDAYAAQARLLAAELARHDITIVYGGARVGLMGMVADSVLAAGGKVIGVIPHALEEKEVAHHGLTELHVVGSMHERKALMADLSDGFIALPGGIGTFEELFEIWTWAQLGLHAKPCGLLNVDAYYDQLVAFLDHAASEGFIKRPQRDMLIMARTADELIARFKAYAPPVVEQWIKPDET